MFKMMVGAATAALALGAFGQAQAQDPMSPGNPSVGSSQESVSGRDPQERSVRSQGRLTRGENNRRQRQPAAPDPAQVMADAQAQLAAAGNACQVTEAVLMGVDTERQNVYEAACATGPGYIVVASTPPALTDCVLLAGSAAVARERDPESDERTCALPGNQNALAVIGAYAREAGIRCEIDQALAAGAASDGAVIYEVGCAGEDGFWLRQQPAGGWTVTECMQIVSQNGTCRYTTTAEQIASMRTRLAGSDAGECDIQQARYMGANANGRFYEVSCAVGDGYIARVGEAGVDQVYPCAIAQPIGGGCTMTQAPAAPAGGRA